MSSQKHGSRRVREAEAGAREMEALRMDMTPVLRHQLIHFVFPFDAEVVAGGLLELVEGPAGVHAEAKGGGFAGAFQGIEFFTGLDGALAAFQLLAIEPGVRPVLGADAADVAGGAGAERVAGTAAPVIDVVPASEGGDGGLGKWGETY